MVGGRLMIKPASDILLNKLSKSLLSDPLKGLQTSLVIFPNSGVTTVIRYLVEEPNTFFKPTPTEHVYFVHISSGFNYFLVNLKKDLLEILKIADPTPKSFEPKEVLDVVKTFFDKEPAHKFVFVLNKFHLMFDLENIRILEFFNTIKSLNKNCSYLFIVSKELGDENIIKFQGFAGFFVRKIIWGKEVGFDDTSAKLMVETELTTKKSNLSSIVTDKLLTLCKGDPTVLKISLLALISDQSLSKKFEDAPDPLNIFELVGDTALTIRYERILSSLKSASLECLLNKYNNPTDFLVNTGLVIPTSTTNKYVAHNPLFDAFVQKHRDLIAQYLDGIADVSTDLELLKKSFTGQETLLFKLFSASPDKIVEREEVAKTLWGDKWEEKYSDWAIDKIISTMRGKLSKYNYSKTIKTFKGQGFMMA